MKKENDSFPNKMKPFFGKELVVVNIGIRLFMIISKNTTLKPLMLIGSHPLGEMTKSWHYWIRS
jgi:hypothetical protein